MIALALAAAAALSASEPAVGAKAPDFTITADDGTPWHLADHAGHTVVLVFYPKAFTGG